MPTALYGGAQVSRDDLAPPPLVPGGYTVGEQVYYTGASHTFEWGDRLEHGKQGEVVGPATSESYRGKGVDVLFPGNEGAIPCSCCLIKVRRGRRRAATHSSPLAQPITHYGWRVGAQVSRGQPPPLPGGYTVGEQVYFTGTSQTLESDYRLEHGKQGEVVGPAALESLRGKGVDVRFLGNKGLASCYPIQVRRRRRRAATPTAPRCPSCPSSRYVACGRTGEP
eukprot:scaffold53913_cov67-Phaeocystis_antarctica.AAC.10